MRLGLAAMLAFSAAACSTTSPTQVLDVRPISSDKYAAIVIDANSGRTLYSASADQVRYPASLTKMMTLYMVFEALDSGRISTSTRIPMSAYAASRPPTKMGIKPGGSIDVDNAIKALVVRSANDVATAIGEHLGGSEAQFAANMTARARSLGMTRTVFRNASGLPDAGQHSSARDMALLGMALKRRFPHHYGYFSTRSFTYAGKVVRSHNKLLETGGVDGIKTGYIRASGFNVVTSVNRNGKRLIVTVMGGESANGRNAHVRALIEKYLPAGSSRGGTVHM